MLLMLVNGDSSHPQQHKASLDALLKSLDESLAVRGLVCGPESEHNTYSVTNSTAQPQTVVGWQGHLLNTLHAGRYTAGSSMQLR